MRIFLIILLAFNYNLLFAQPGEAPIVDKGGQKCYEHTVQAGTTLWGLQQMYHVSSEEIIKYNPGVESGLKAGQKVYIPVKESQKKLIDYKVNKGETLYGISKKFDTTVDELMALNPELKDGLKKGQVIKVPSDEDVVVRDNETVIQNEVTTPNPFASDTVQVKEQEPLATDFNDSIVEHTVLAHETLYSISKRYMVPVEKIMEVNGLRNSSVKKGQILIIPLKKERTERVEIREVIDDIDRETDPLDVVFEKKDHYKIALFAPFYLDYGKGYSEYVSRIATQYYLGVKTALDSLKMKGLNADVYVFDTKNDSATVVGILNSKGVANMDLVISPFFSKTQQIVADFCYENQIRMVCPVKANGKILDNNPFVYASVPSDVKMIQGLAKYTLKHNSNDNIVIIKPTKPEDLVLYNAFIKTFKEEPYEGTRPRLIETNVDGMKVYLQKSKDNIIVVPTNNNTFARKFMFTLNRSNFRARKDGLYVYGTKEWADFTDVNGSFKNTYNLHFASPNYVDYYTEEMIELNKQFRANYKTDMSMMAIQGYDVMTYFCSSFFMENDQPYLIMNGYDFEQISESDGYMNNHVFILQQEEFELIKASHQE